MAYVKTCISIEYQNKNTFIEYCGIFAQGRIVKPAETAVASEQLCKQRLLRSCGHPTRHEHNNGVTVGSGVFYAVCTEMLYAGQVSCCS
jgi:hypothetical protein